jgi:pyruvate dehydrogenase E1 component
VATERKRPVISDGLPSQLPDIDPEETTEWIESFDGVVDERGAKRARYIMLRLLERARNGRSGYRR